MTPSNTEMIGVITLIPCRCKVLATAIVTTIFWITLSGLLTEIRFVERGNTARNTEDFLPNLPPKASVPPCEPILQQTLPSSLFFGKGADYFPCSSHTFLFHLVMHLAYLPHSNNEENLCITVSQNNRSSLHGKPMLLKWAQEQFLFCSFLFYSHL